MSRIALELAPSPQPRTSNRHACLQKTELFLALVLSSNRHAIIQTSRHIDTWRRSTQADQYFAVGGQIAELESFTEGNVCMRSLGELADNYDRWATENEAIALTILSDVSGCPEHVRDERLLEVSLLTYEAEFFRHHAARLRPSALENIAMLLGSQARTPGDRPCNTR